MTRPMRLLGFALLALGCATPAAPPSGPALLPETRFAPIVPDAADHAAAELAAAALLSDSLAAAAAVVRIEMAERTRGDEPPSGLVPAAADVLNATLHSGRDYRHATETLLERDDLPEALRSRLERSQADDPLALADARIRDARMVSAARLFNAMAEPAGHALLSATLLPYQIAHSVARYAIEIAEQDPLTLQRRQALVHWKEFLARHPDAAESVEIRRDVEKAQRKWDATQRNHALASAKSAHRRGAAYAALFHAERALRHAPQDEESTRLRDRALALVRLQEDAARRSLRVAEGPPEAIVPEGSRDLALALLAPHGNLEVALARLPEDSPLASEARFAAAVVRGESGDDAALWAGLEALAESGDDDPMARHAAAAIADPVRNPHAAFVAARSKDRWGRALWVLLGPAAKMPRMSTTGVARWLLSLPARVNAIVAMPVRLIQVPFDPPAPTAARTAVQARRYLALHPGGRHASEVRGWLSDYERSRENWLGALHVASSGHTLANEIEELREKAAAQVLSVATREQRRDLRNAMLHNVTREFPDTAAGREAGRIAREEASTMTAHHVRISRGFLEENPAVAGPEGLGLDPALLDEDASNGELHPNGVTLVGGRQLELHFIEAGGDEDDPSERVYVEVDAERLARLVAQLEEQSFRNSLVDEDDEIVPDPQRDLFFERARLGLADDVDTRATAEADYAYRGMRERYGMVRARESILPFDIVVQGDLGSLSLGAFPRLNPPRKTPDAVLYE